MSPTATHPKNGPGLGGGKGIAAPRDQKHEIRVSPLLVEVAMLDAAGVYARLGTRPEGLAAAEAAARLAKHGPNVMARDAPPSSLRRFACPVLNPLVILLAVLATISFATGDPGSGAVMLAVIGLSLGLKLVQEARADSAAAKLKAMTSLTATVVRGGPPAEIAVADLVPGDVLTLSAGDMVPGDVRIVQAKDLFVIHGSLTGESFPVEKFDVAERVPKHSPLELDSVGFLGISVESGAATAVVVATGAETYLGGMSRSITEEPAQTSFDRGIARFTGLMLRFMAVMVPLVFLLNGLTKGRWSEEGGRPGSDRRPRTEVEAMTDAQLGDAAERPRSSRASRPHTSGASSSRSRPRSTAWASSATGSMRRLGSTRRTSGSASTGPSTSRRRRPT